MFLGSTLRPGRKTDNLTAICEQIVYKMWHLPHKQTYMYPRLVTEIAFLQSSLTSFHKCLISKTIQVY
jgi:hypothetical protein